MNFIFGLCFTLVGATLFWLYLLFLLFALFCIRWVWACRQKIKNGFTNWLDQVKQSDTDDNGIKPAEPTAPLSRPGFFRKNDKRLAILMAVITFSIAGFTYIDQRADWMGDDNAHFKAKEYFVAGQVVLGFRNIVDIFFHPDSRVEAPFISLQKWIYDRGVQHLPENDGESGVWKNNWFVYPIAKKMGYARRVGSSEYSPRMISLLDTAWSAMEQQANFPFADRRMEVQHYYQNFAGQAFYYNYRKAYYAGKTIGAGVFLTRDKKMIARSKKLVKWLDELENKWQTSPETQAFLKEHPKVAAIRQFVCLMEWKDIIRNEIVIDKFACDNESVRQYLKYRQEFSGDGTNRPPYQMMADFEQSQRLYNVAINIEANRLIRYTLEKYCGLEAAGREDMSRYEGRGIPTEVLFEKSMNNLFNEEMKKIKEWNNDR